MSANAAIEIVGLKKRFGSKVALDAVEMRVASGAVFGFLGENGAGKTTTIRILLGLIRPDAGDVRVLGLDPSARPKEVRRAVGVLLDHDGHYERLTALENLKFHAGIRGLDRGASLRTIEELLRTMALWDNRAERVATFSKGMRQKLAVARALLGDPRVLLLDEPFTGLDPAASVELRDRLRDLAERRGVTIFLTTHDLHHVEEVCDSVLVLERGRVVANGTVDEIGRDAEGEDVLVEGDNLDDGVLGDLGAKGIILQYERLAPTRVAVRCANGARKRLAMELVSRGVEVHEIAHRRRTLEETFMKIVSSPRQQ